MSHKRIHTVSSLLTLAILLVLAVGGAVAPAQGAPLAQTVSFTAPELLGKPTDHSIVVNVIPASDIELYYEYGTTSGVYTAQTATVSAAAGEPTEVTITGLQPNTRYYYRMQYHTSGGSWVARTEHYFWTQRAPGSTFKFTIVSDSHAMYNTQYQQAITNIINEQPDFHFDLGDTFMTDNATSQSTVNNEYLAQRKPQYLDGVGCSVPVFLASGNHENEEGWNFDDSFSIALASVKARKLYFPTPIDDGEFYSGNLDPLTALDAGTYGDQLREDYYAWEWGDALFVVFDPFQYTMANPYGATAGESSDDPASGDRWNWTMGKQQYDWFKATLENSDAPYKFIFAHHMLGGTQNYVRGGAVPAHMFEWGGYNSDGTTWGYTTKRPDWGDDPIHQLLVDNHVSAFFHGHDHQYAYEVRDGIVYQSLPRPSTGLDFNYYSESDPYTERVLASPGHLLVTITPDAATVDYVSSSGSGAGISYSYTILPAEVGPTYDLTVAVSPSGGGTTDPAAGTHTYSEGSSVTVTATPQSGYQFDHWSGACTGSGTCQVTMDADKSVTANFAAPASYNLTVAVSPSGAGTTTPTVGVHSYTQGTVVSVAATAGAGYIFDHWVGAVADTGSASTTISMDGDQTATAYFVLAPVVLGGVNSDGLINSTDALIILSCDVGMDTTQFCPMDCGDVNGDGGINSTDALIVLSYDADMEVPFGLGEDACPTGVAPCAGCGD